MPGAHNLLWSKHARRHTINTRAAQKKTESAQSPATWSEVTSDLVRGPVEGGRSGREAVAVTDSHREEILSRLVLYLPYPRAEMREVMRARGTHAARTLRETRLKGKAYATH